MYPNDDDAPRHVELGDIGVGAPRQRGGLKWPAKSEGASARLGGGWVSHSFGVGRARLGDATELCLPAYPCSRQCARLSRHRRARAPGSPAPAGRRKARDPFMHFHACGGRHSCVNSGRFWTCSYHHLARSSAVLTASMSFLPASSRARAAKQENIPRKNNIIPSPLADHPLH